MTCPPAPDASRRATPRIASPAADSCGLSVEMGALPPGRRGLYPRRRRLPGLFRLLGLLRLLRRFPTAAAVTPALDADVVDEPSAVLSDHRGLAAAAVGAVGVLRHRAEVDGRAFAAL